MFCGCLLSHKRRAKRRPYIVFSVIFTLNFLSLINMLCVPTSAHSPETEICSYKSLKRVYIKFHIIYLPIRYVGRIIPLFSHYVNRKFKKFKTLANTQVTLYNLIGNTLGGEYYKNIFVFCVRVFFGQYSFCPCLRYAF